MSDTPTRKEKKEAQRLKNRKSWELFTQFRQMNDQAAEMAAAPAPAPAPEHSAEVLAADMAAIRSRITGRRTASRERWNRYAGTSGGGGRGL